LIEIQEKDIAIVEDDGDFYVEGKIISICRRDNEGFDYDKCNQLRQQILNDRQIVERLNERIGKLESIGRDDYTNGALELQNIRDGKN